MSISYAYILALCKSIHIRDLVEISCLGFVTYKISIWLKRDSQHHLLGYFYLYCIALMASYALYLPTISLLLLVAAPIVATLGIILHQETLQRNYVMLRQKVTQPQDHAQEWLEQCFRSYLVALNNGKELITLIEHTHQLNPLVSLPIHVNAPISQDLYTLIMHSSLFEHTKMIWISSNGILKGINASWSIQHDSEWHTQSVKELHLWQQNALLMTMKTDALVVKTNVESRSFDIVVSGKLFEQVNATHALALIKKHIALSSPSLEGGISYESHNQKSTLHQRTP